MKTVMATFVAGLGLTLLVALLWQDPEARSLRGGTDDDTGGGSTISPASSTTDGTTPPAASSPTSASSMPLPGSSASSPKIETTEDLYFGRPYETIGIDGTYHGAATETTLRVQLRRPDGWKTFPLPVVTQEGGSFRAYVELGRGQYRLRIVDPATGLTSEILTLLLL